MDSRRFFRAAFLTAAALSLWCGFLSAQEMPPEDKPLVFAKEAGGYAIYRDGEAPDSAYIGLCHTRGNELAIRLYEPAGGNELVILQTFYVRETAAAPAGDGAISAGDDAMPASDDTAASPAVSAGKNSVVEPGSIRILRGTLESSDRAGRVLSRVYSWINIWLASRDRFVAEPSFEVSGDGTAQFEYWVPVLQLRSIDEGSGDPLTLATAGLAVSATDPAFFAYMGEPAPDAAEASEIAPGTTGSVTMDGLEIPLDSNWTQGKDGVYRIALATPQDACCYVETIDMAEFSGMDIFDLIKFFMLCSGGVLNPDGLRIFASGEYPCAFYRVWDPAAKRTSVQYRMFVPRDRNRLSVVSLAAFEAVYDRNQAYFDSILF